MPIITGKLDNRRAIIDVGLRPSTVLIGGVSPVQDPAIIDIQPMRGLIDTGATITCVTRSAAARAGLRPKGKKLLGNVNSENNHTTYMFVLGVWYEIDEGQTQNSTRGYYGFEPITGCDFRDNPDFDVLIGMDLIGQGNFSTKRDGSFAWDLP
jgi:hypothetical protein